MNWDIIIFKKELQRCYRGLQTLRRSTGSPQRISCYSHFQLRETKQMGGDEEQKQKMQVFCFSEREKHLSHSIQYKCINTFLVLIFCVSNHCHCHRGIMRVCIKEEAAHTVLKGRRPGTGYQVFYKEIIHINKCYSTPSHAV